MLLGALRNVPWLPYVVVSAVHLLLLAAGNPLSTWTHVALMPALLWPALRVRRPLLGWVLAAVGFSWIGDAAPRLLDEPTRFLAMAGGFLLAQLAWVSGLGHRWSLTLPGRRPATGVLYAVAAIGIVASTVPFAGTLAPAVVLYALALTAAAVLATSMGLLGIWGGALFMVSDSLIAMNSFLPGLRFGGLDVLIMFTYVVAQGLLVAAAGRLENPREPLTT